MPLVRISCPVCARTLEIDEEAVGQEVECGSCSEVFVASTSKKGAGKTLASKRASSRDEEKPRTRSRRRKRYDDDDELDEDDYDDYDYEPRGSRRRRRYADQKSRVAYILLGIFLGGLGVHNFYAGRIGPGVAQLIITAVSIPLLCVFVGFITICIPGIWAIVEVIVVDEDGNNVPMVS